ncbi:ABC transporter permease [Corynebacterium tapiri]|nr:FtsX-like permease family protein [Corynebacterium tapiri]
MRRVSLRNIAAHKLRLALTVLAVVLGTAFISGAFMFTNSLKSSFDAAVNNAFTGVDAVVSKEATVEDRETVEANPDVAGTNVSTSQTIVLARDGAEPEPIQTGSGTASLGVWYEPDEQVGDTKTIVEGNAPTNAQEVIINEKAAKEKNLHPGDKLIVVDPQARHQVTLTGLFDSPIDQAGQLKVLIPEQDYLASYAKDGVVDQFIVDAAEGVAPQKVVDELKQALPERDVETGQKLADDTSKAVTSALSFINYFLVAFGLVGLLVGTFLIANTFSMIVAQRTKEFALLRALGASRGQITRSVVLESVIIGVLGSAIGVLVGMGLVAAIKAVMTSRGMALPDSGLGLSPTAVLVPILLGTAVTVVSAWAPARRAGDVEPVEAMRANESSTSQPLLGRTTAGVILLALGVLAALAGVFWDEQETKTRAIAVGVGAVLLVIGFFLAAPALSLPVVPTFGRLLGLPFGAVGRLASTNTRRNPRRTATTSFALALGVALVTVIGMLGATMKQSVADQMESNLEADFALTAPAAGGFPVPAEVPDAVRGVEGVERATTHMVAPVSLDGVFSSQLGPHGGFTDVVDGDPGNIGKLTVAEGTSDLSNGGALATRSLADAHGWRVGQQLQLAGPNPAAPTKPVELVGILDDSQMFRSIVVSHAEVTDVVPADALRIRMVGVQVAEGVNPDDVRPRLEQAVKPFLVVQVMSSEDMAGMVAGLINQILSLLYGLLALAVIIAILGIVNTLTLSVIERRQEIGMLRAVGSYRGQIRQLITLESVQIALFGGLAGVLLGLGIGYAFITSLDGQGLGDPVIPWPLVAAMLAGSVLIGLFAAIWPAQRAAKTPPLDAISD